MATAAPELPLAGAMTVRYGFRPIMMVGALLYVAGLVLMASAQGFLSIMIGAGVLIGVLTAPYAIALDAAGIGAGRTA